jgi:hypothetical protein
MHIDMITIVYLDMSLLDKCKRKEYIKKFRLTVHPSCLLTLLACARSTRVDRLLCIKLVNIHLDACLQVILINLYIVYRFKFELPRHSSGEGDGQENNMLCSQTHHPSVRCSGLASLPICWQRMLFLRVCWYLLCNKPRERWARPGACRYILL